MIFCLTTVFFLPTAVFAHQPRVVGNETSIRVEEPEISKAYYGELSGQPVNYYISSSQPFDLYVGLLLPVMPGVVKNLSAKIYRNSELISELNGIKFDWKFFYEEFANDEYWWGPEFRSLASPAEYRVEVYRPDENSGKYIVAIGEKESFPLSEIITTARNLPKVKIFMGRSLFTLFFSITGFFISCVLVVFCILIIITRFLFWKFTK